jgi:hypothetical protein
MILRMRGHRGFANQVVTRRRAKGSTKDHNALRSLLKRGETHRLTGGTVLPLVWDRLADSIGSQQAYWMLVPCYVVIYLYASVWYKKRSW